jgi:protein-L-isoaspartate(D-aspartate) O-methyltransferase
MPVLFSLRLGAKLRLAAKSVVLAILTAMDAPAQDGYATQRNAMLEDVARIAWETLTETGREKFSPRVTEALGRVPRHRLVRSDQQAHAYDNRPLAIGLGQTISQPFIVALMTDLLAVQRGDKVLEIGTGSGYQTAVLAELGAKVYTIEIIEALGRQAQERLAELGYANIETRIGDGYAGWPEHAPFDSIIVTAAAPDVPNALEQQLRTGGKLVIPLGTQEGAQMLYVIEKQADGRFHRHPILAVRFVPLTRGGGRVR